jgi:hypothetical protein
MNSEFPPHPSAGSFNTIGACRIPPRGFKRSATKPALGTSVSVSEAPGGCWTDSPSNRFQFDLWTFRGRGVNSDSTMPDRYANLFPRHKHCTRAFVGMHAFGDLAPDTRNLYECRWRKFTDWCTN